MLLARSLPGVIPERPPAAQAASRRMIASI
jgi:hypothetical protein